MALPLNLPPTRSTDTHHVKEVVIILTNGQQVRKTFSEAAHYRRIVTRQDGRPGHILHEVFWGEEL